ncbi:hypothetical protein CYLTODRAFT_417147 [Cylindrobasidium torrendii FP15055 ss-10]|uniref:Uncharacterized protein n=1 Tax=Cylindrobasidium torrendii FP15055 ss-10 TaxID=1314674 RepID=A0A0D7BRI4_9AGAR|nr:hypothetical protein CYLTODRAFT_417147 [Cylindrobasidium torrendii FP15055 ss-10]
MSWRFPTEQPSKKGAARSSTFENQKKALFANAREQAVKTSEAVPNQMGNLKNMLAMLREDEINYEDVTRALDEKEAAADELSQAVFAKHPALIADLFPRRRIAIEAACDTLKTHQADREDALGRFLRNAHVQVETARRDEKLATDASNLIRHYKSLLLA